MSGTATRHTRLTRHTRRFLSAAPVVSLAAMSVVALPAAASPPSGVILDVAAKPVLDWSVPRRFEGSWAAYDEYAARYDADFVNPPRWGLNLNGCSSTAVRRIKSYTFTVRQVGTTWLRTYASSTCALQLPNTLPAQGQYQATLTLHTDWGAEDGVSVPTSMNVGIRDHLIVSMGDSLASGEGNPDDRGSYKFNLDVDWPPAHVEQIRAARWQDRRCHRSARSGPSLAAKAFEDADPKTSVTFVSVACSGAKVAHLISSSYGGIAPIAKTTVPPQVDVVAQAVGPNSNRDRRTIDSLLVSAGINDLYFSSVIRRCAKNDNFKKGHESCVTSSGIATTAGTLPLKYANLAIAIRDRLPGTREVYLNNYPTEVFEGGACGLLGGMLGNTPLPGIGIDKVEESEMNIYGNILNRHIENATRSFNGPPFRWNLVDSLPSEFLPHAYCDSLTWFTKLEKSLAYQGDVFGTAHPNREGHVGFGQILHGLVVPAQVSSPYRRLKIVIDAVKAKAVTGGQALPVTAKLWQFQNDHRGLAQYFNVPRNGQWTSVPAGKGAFFLDVYPTPSSPRHAVEVRMGFNSILGFHHGRSDAYGAGTHVLTHPQGALSVRYTVIVQPAPTSGSVVG